MASGSSGRAEELPPALPVKQHRSRSRSSADSDGVPLSPVGPPNYTADDVFAQPTDCQAAQCPLHQHRDPSPHQERCFCDSTPLPLPQKTWSRALSLPDTSPPCSPPSPRQGHPHHIHNPLYVLPPTSRHPQPETGEAWPAPGSRPAPWLPPSFHTPDEDLRRLFGGFSDHRVVSEGIQRCHLVFLRSVAQRVESAVLLGGGTDTGSYRPRDFLLSEDEQPKLVGGRVYYRAHSPRFPGRVLGLKVHKHPGPAHHPPPHVNVQSVLARFTPAASLKNHLARSQAQHPSVALEPECSAAEAPHGVATEGPSARPGAVGQISVRSFLGRGFCASIERDLPRLSLKDFVQESLRSSECLVYDRQVCVLLLQVLTGAHHLYATGGAAAQLRPEAISLVWHHEESEDQWVGKEAGIRALWSRLGSPRVVLSPHSASRSLSSVGAQIGSLLQFCLSPHESSASSPSSYRRALLHLSPLLRDGSRGPRMAEAAALLRVLLWGPRLLLRGEGAVTAAAAARNWLSAKRALLVMKLAEGGAAAPRDRSALDWEDCMCLRYLALSDPETVVSASAQLWRTMIL